MSTDPNESHDPYVETREGQLYVRGSDVRLERLLLAWSHGRPPEVLRDKFPSLSLAAIYGAVAHYLSYKDDMDRLLDEYQRQHPEERAAGHFLGYQVHRVERVESNSRFHDDSAIFDRFTERARKIVGLAHEEAQRLNHNYVGTEHLLLGLVLEGDGVAAKVLRDLGVELQAVRGAVESIVGRGDRIVAGDIGMTPRLKKVMELAVDEARRLGHHYVGTEHLLLGIVREGEGIAAGVLESLGVNLEKVRITTITVLGTHVSQPGQSATGTTTIRTTTIQSDQYGVSYRGRFDKFDARARKTLSLAQEEAQRFNHNYIGTEHLLLGLAKDGDSTAAKVLGRMDVDLRAVRGAVEHIIGRGDRIVLGDIGLTPRSKTVIELAVDEARRRDAHYIGTEHLLLGAIREGEGIAAGVLESLGVTYERAVAATDEVLREQGGQEE